MFLISLILLCVIYDPVSACMNGWIGNGSYCYMFSHQKESWGEATAICSAFNSYLAEPSTPDVDAFIASQSAKNKRIYWLGGSDIFAEGNWIWTSSEQPFEYTNWKASDPNNAGPGEDCLLNDWYGQGKWEDWQCAQLEYYICQRENEDIDIVG